MHLGGVFPAGQAWVSALSHDPSLPIYGTDGYHPAPLGTYLAALVVYEGITGHECVRERLGEHPCLFLEELANDRHVDVNAGTPRGLHQWPE